MAPNPDPMSSMDGREPPGLRAQIGAVVAAARRLLTAHIDLAKAEAGEIMGEVGRVAILAGIAVALLLMAGLLMGIGTILWLGDWLFGSIGWGALLGTLFLVDVAVALVLAAVGVSAGRLGRAFILGAIVGIVVGLVLGFDLTNRAWTVVGDALLPTLQPETRPLVAAVVGLGAVGGLLGLAFGWRGGAAISGLVSGVILGAILGVITAIALGPQVGAAFGVLAWLLAWPAFVALDLSGNGIDTEALKARFYPNATIETTKETIEWVRQRTPLGPRS